MTSNCETILQEGDSTKGEDTKLVCLGVGRTIRVPMHYDVTVDPIEDGWYNTFQLKDNCIVAVGNEQVQAVVAPPCSPTPQPCGGSGEGSETISSDRGNLLERRSTGLYAGISFAGANGVTVSGDGTKDNPLTISGSGSGGGEGYISQITATTESGIEVAQAGSVVSLSLRGTGVVSGTYNGMKFNSYGQLIGIDPDANDGLYEITAGMGIAIDSATPGLKEISLAPILTGGTVISVGANSYNMDEYGRVDTVYESTSPYPEAGKYTPDRIRSITVNPDGQIGDIERIPDDEVSSGLPVNFSQVFTGANREEDIVDFTTTVAGSYSFEIYNSGITATAPLPAVITQGLSVVFNNRGVITYALSAGHALAISEAMLAAGSFSVEIRYPTPMSNPTIIRIVQEITA